MTKPELISAIQQAGLFPVPIKDEVNEMSLPSFDGELKEFLAAAKALECKAILVCSYTFDETDFLELLEADEEEHYLDTDEDEDDVDTDDEDDEDEDEDEEDDEVQSDVIMGAITERFPALAKYQKYLGQDSLFSLTATGGVIELNLELVEDWYLKFEQKAEDLEEVRD